MVHDEKPTDTPTAGATESRLTPILPGVVVFLATLVVYLKTLCPSIFPGDGAELIAAASCLGVSHPTGYPLFMVLGWFVQHLGLGSPAFSMNVLCALSGSGAAVGAWWLGLELWRSVRGEEQVKAPWRYASAGAALLAGLGAMWWDQSNQTEVYSLLLLFLTTGWALGVRVIRRPSRRGLLLLACWSGIAFLHHQLFLLTFPLSAAAAWTVLRSEAAKARGATLGLSVVAFAVPLLGYGYLPLRAAADPPVNWGDPDGFDGIVWHLTGAQYRGTRVLTDGMGRPLRGAEVTYHVKTRLGGIVRWLGEQIVSPRSREDVRPPVFGLVMLLLTALGLVSLTRHARWVALGLGGAIALNVVIVVLYTIPDIAVYQLPLWLLAVLLAMVGGASGAASLWGSGSEIGEAARRQGAEREVLRAWVACGAAVALAGWAVFNWYPAGRGVNKAETIQAWEYARGAMSVLPEKSVVFTGGDYDAFPLWYAQIAEGMRPDTAIVGANFVMNGWYRAMLAANLPKDLEMFVTDEPPSTKQRWLTALIGGMVTPALESGRPVFLTFHHPEIERVWGFTVQPAFQLPLPFPSPDGSPLFLYRVAADSPARNAATRRWHAAFPDWQNRMVPGRREVVGMEKGASPKESAP